MYQARSISLESVKKGSRGGKYKKQKNHPQQGRETSGVTAVLIQHTLVLIGPISVTISSNFNINTAATKS